MKIFRKFDLQGKKLQQLIYCNYFQCQHILAVADMRIVLLSSGSIFVNLSSSSPNLKVFEVKYEIKEIT